MKYFEELNEVEIEVNRLAEMRKLLAVIVNGADSSKHEEILSAISYIEGSIDDISKRLSYRFQILFNSIASEGDE